MGIRFGIGVIRRKYPNPDEIEKYVTIRFPVPKLMTVIILIILVALLLLIPFRTKAMDNTKRTKCQVYSRVVGYLSPVGNWNKGKAAEWKDRKTFDSALTYNKQ